MDAIVIVIVIVRLEGHFKWSEELTNWLTD